MNFSRYEGLDALRIFSSLGVVFLHVYVSAGSPNSLEWLLKLRDFALPVMVMSSFFLLTVSLRRKREAGFADFLSRRVDRLWIPLIVWTFIYCSVATYVFPVLSGAAGDRQFPAPLVFLTGYRHLWYLQFIFIGSLAIYPLVSRLSGEGRFPSPAFWWLAALLYGFLYYSLLKDYAVWENFDSEADISLGILLPQAAGYVLYIPLAVGIALVSSRIRELFSRAVFRRASAAAVLFAMLAHTGTSGVPLTREFYGIAFFLAALQPWRRIQFGFVRTLAAYSYGIYILHFLLIQVLWIIFARYDFEPGAAAVPGITLFVYVLSFAAAVLIRKTFSAGWLIPLAGETAKKARDEFPPEAVSGTTR